MPLVKVNTSVDIDTNRKQQLLCKISSAVSEITGKPETYIMTSIDHGEFLMAGKPGPTAFLDVRGIGGLDGATNGRLSEALCDIMTKSLGIPADRTYINFTDVAGSNWGWNNSTFG